MCELRIDMPLESLQVIDGYCQATGLCRTDLVRDILNAWSEKKLHEATIILRVAGRNPATPGGHAAQGGVASESERSATGAAKLPSRWP